MIPIGGASALVLVLGGALGASLGSFADVLVERAPRGRSVLGRSHCPHCERRLRAFENVPVLAWLVLRGRCRTCRARIPVRVLVVEGIGLVAGVVVTAVCLR